MPDTQRPIFDPQQQTFRFPVAVDQLTTLATGSGNVAISQKQSFGLCQAVRWDPPLHSLGRRTPNCRSFMTQWW